MRKFGFYFCLFTFYFLLSQKDVAQTLTVKDIMREPSIAGMRAEGEKLSPDGSKVIFLWNAEGKDPKNLYLWNGGEAKIIVRPQDLLSANPTPTPENKLNYGLIVKDEFVKSRENQIGNLEWSPDSDKILFSQNGDVYVLNIDTIETLQAKRGKFESEILQRANSVPRLIRAAKAAGINDEVLFDRLLHSRLQTLAMLKKIAEGEIKYDENSEYERAISMLKNLPTLFPQLGDNDVFLERLKVLKQFEETTKLAQVDYNNWIKSSLIKPDRITKTQMPEFSARWLDNKRILFQQNGNLFSIDTEKVSLIQLSKEANPTAFISVGNATPTKDGKLVAYVVSDNSKQRTLFVPNYLDEFVQAPTTRRGWSDQKILVVQTDGNRETLFEIKLPKAEGLGYLRSIKWAADNASLVVDRIDKDTKRRQIFYINNVGSKAEQTILVTEETDEKWIAPLSRIVEPNPKNDSQILFASEKDGFNHLYLATLERRKNEPTKEISQMNLTDSGFTAKVDIKQITSGKFEVDWAKWSNNERVIFSSTEENTAERQIYQIILPTMTKSKILTGQSGLKTNFQIADINESVTKYIYSSSKWNQPTEIFISGSCNVKCEQIAPEQITKTASDTFLKSNWKEPKFLDIPSRDGKVIKSKVYIPNVNVTSKLPMVIFVHGAGYLQNTINGWNNYYREFMFNQMLTQQGYVVLDIDFRGSAGYGRDWRTDVYDFLGGKDYEDHLDAIDYAVKNFNVNPNKIGVYGGSYGGFMAEMLAFRTDKITCAAALRPVADWKNYYASSNVYTAERLGFPDKNPEGYKRSSPISYAEGLNKPLLILHGMVDDNVHAQDSVQLIEKLMRLEKTNYFEAMLYPSENHGFTRPSSWTDEYERILNFFNKHLRN